MPNHSSVDGYVHQEINQPKIELRQKLILLQKRVKFMNQKVLDPNCINVIYEKGFHKDRMSRGMQKISAKWKLNPIPTKY